MVSKFRRDAGYICEEQTDAENLRKVPQKCTWFSWGYSARADVYHGVFIECGFYHFKNLPDYYMYDVIISILRRHNLDI